MEPNDMLKTLSIQYANHFIQEVLKNRAEVCITEGEYGRAMVLKKAWAKHLERDLERMNVLEMWLNTAWGWPAGDTAFLRKCVRIYKLFLLSNSAVRMDNVNILHNLRSLSIEAQCLSPLDFTGFPHLTECCVPWYPKHKSLFSCQGLLTLAIGGFAGQDCESYASFSVLKNLTINGGALVSVSGISALTDLEHIALLDLRKLTSLEGIEKNRNLKSVRVSGCRGLTDIAPIAHVSGLEVLDLTNCGHIESLYPLRNLARLREVWFTEDTNIVDGDMSPLFTLPSLTVACFANRRHYSHSVSAFSDGGRK